MGRPPGKASKLEERRRRAVEMVEKDCLTQAEAARRLKVDARTLRKWVTWHQGKGLRKLAARTVPSLHRAIRSFLHILKPRECAHYYKHAGYAAI